MSADVGLDSGHSVFPSVVISSLIVSNRHLTIDQSKIQQSTRLNKNFKKKVTLICFENVEHIFDESEDPRLLVAQPFLLTYAELWQMT